MSRAEVRKRVIDLLNGQTEAEAEQFAEILDELMDAAIAEHCENVPHLHVHGSLS